MQLGIGMQLYTVYRGDEMAHLPRNKVNEVLGSPSPQLEHHHYDHSTGLVDKISLRTTREADTSAYNWLLAPPSLVAASGSTRVDNELRARVHPHRSVACVCICMTSGSHSIRSATATRVLSLSSSLEVDGRFAV